MNNFSFPWLALGLALLVGGGLFTAGAFAPDAAYRLPLLTMLVLAEFGFFVSAIGAGLGIKSLRDQGMNASLLGVSIADALFALLFLYLGIRMWPGNFPV